MGTRNLTAVYKNGKHVVAQYGQWDGYPSSMGNEILDFLKTLSNEENYTKFNQQLDKCSFATVEERTNFLKLAGIAPDQEWVTFAESNRLNEIWPYKNRDVGGSVLSMIMNDPSDRILLEDNLEFVYNGLFCEWAYVVDLDTKTFEIYKGFQRTPLEPSERFWKPEQKEIEYYAAKKVASYSLNNLPKEEFDNEAFESE